eukprot:5968936-Amphidinium_carterae.1
MQAIHSANLQKVLTSDSAGTYKTDVFVKQAMGKQLESVGLICFKCLGEVENEPSKYYHKGSRTCFAQSSR